MDNLDVTLIDPRLKHPTIFQKFDSLKPRDGFVIHNDHDPLPLYYQLLAERGPIFTWEYLQEGPELWKVKIYKKQQAMQTVTIGELVAHDFRTAQIFKKYGIDFCCGGKKTLAEVCERKQIDVGALEAELADITKVHNDDGAQNFQAWSLDFLCDYIVNNHHNYVKESIPFLSEISQKVARVHGERHKELYNLAVVFARIANELNSHMKKEEMILFPYIKEMVAAQKEGGVLPKSHFGEVANPIHVMETEHESAGEDLSEIRELTNNYQLPADACTSYRILFQKLQEFENDLMRHIHLENNILFPKAKALEDSFKEIA